MSEEIKRSWKINDKKIKVVTTIEQQLDIDKVNTSLVNVKNQKAQTEKERDHIKGLLDTKTLDRQYKDIKDNLKKLNKDIKELEQMRGDYYGKYPKEKEETTGVDKSGINSNA